MTIYGRFIVVSLALVLIFLTIFLMRKRSLEVEYGFLWISCSLIAIVVVSFDKLLMAITHLTGAIYPVSALTFFSLLLIVLVLIFLTSRISILSIRLKELTQCVALSSVEKIEKDKRENAGCGNAVVLSDSLKKEKYNKTSSGTTL